MKITILGTRGIPNCYGGFEQFAEIFALNAVKLGHQVSVYISHTHPFQEKKFHDIEIIHCYDQKKNWYCRSIYL